VSITYDVGIVLNSEHSMMMCVRLLYVLPAVMLRFMAGVLFAVWVLPVFKVLRTGNITFKCKSTDLCLTPNGTEMRLPRHSVSST
jgi:hypothetical protein